MTQWKVVFSDEAKQDLKAIHDYIAYDLVEPGTAVKAVVSIRDALRRLESFPESAPVLRKISELLHVEVRQLVVKNYSVFYYLKKDRHRVVIARVANGRRNIDNLF